MTGMRVTDADLVLLRQCRRSRSTFAHEAVRFKSQYRRKGSVTTFWLVGEGDNPTVEVVTRRVKRLLAAGLVERCLSASPYGPDGDVVLTDAGRAVVDGALAGSRERER